MGPEVGQVAVIPGADSLVGYAICKLTESRSRHMVICTGPDECVSADGEFGVGRVRRRALADFPTAVWSRYDLADGQREQVAAFALAQVGKPYAYVDDALIAVERIFRFRFPDPIRESFADGNAWQCAQLADAALAAGGLKAFDDGRAKFDVFPGSFEQDWIRRGWYTEDFFGQFPLLIGNRF